MTGRHTCPRCQGVGTIAAFRTVAGGRCFGCHGTGTVARKPRATRRRRPQGQGANEALWAEFAAAHPAEAAVIEAGKDDHPMLGYAHSSVACFDRRDTNWDQALALVARHQEGR